MPCLARSRSRCPLVPTRCSTTVVPVDQPVHSKVARLFSAWVKGRQLTAKAEVTVRQRRAAGWQRRWRWRRRRRWPRRRRRIRRRPWTPRSAMRRRRGQRQRIKVWRTKRNVEKHILVRRRGRRCVLPASACIFWTRPGPLRRRSGEEERGHRYSHSGSRHAQPPGAPFGSFELRKSETAANLKRHHDGR